jgi:hypothetical protein
MSELDPAGPEYAEVANRFHQAEGEFRARDGAHILGTRNKLAKVRAAK